METKTGNKSKKKSSALYIGRFQPFHKAHLKDVKNILKKHDRIIICIGSAWRSKVKDNPFTVTERRDMINRSLKDEGIKNFTIHFVPDIPEDNKWPMWVKNLVGNFDVVYTGNRYPGELMKKAGFKVKYIKLVPGYSSTKVRKWIAEGNQWQKLVPEGTIEVIKKIDGEKRVKKLVKFK